MLTSPIKDEVLFDPLTSYWLLARREWWMYPFPALLKCRQDYCTHLPEVWIPLSSLAHVAGIWGCGSLSFFAITTGLIGGLCVSSAGHRSRALVCIVSGCPLPRHCRWKHTAQLMSIQQWQMLVSLWLHSIVEYVYVLWLPRNRKRW
jgi:hypothetical protein